MEEFLELIEKEGYKALSEYEGALENMDLLCPNGCVYRVKPNNFKNLNQRCACRVPKLQKELDDNFGKVYEVMEYKKGKYTIKHLECEENNVFTIGKKSILQRKNVFCNNCNLRERKFRDRVFEHYRKYFDFHERIGIDTYHISCKNCGYSFTRCEKTMLDALDRGNRTLCPCCETYKKKNESKQASYLKHIFSTYLKDVGEIELEMPIRTKIDNEDKILYADIVISKPIKLHIEVNGSQHRREIGRYTTNQRNYNLKVQILRENGYELLEIDCDDNFYKNIESYDDIIKSVLDRCNINYDDFEHNKNISLEECYKNREDKLYDMKDEIKKLCEKGYTYKEIAKELELSKKSVIFCVKNILKIDLVEIRNNIRKQKEQEIKNKAINLYKNGSTFQELSDKFGVSTSYIYTILKDEERHQCKVVKMNVDGEIKIYKCMYDFIQDNNTCNTKKPNEFTYFRNKLNAYVIDYEYFMKMDNETKQNMIDTMKKRAERMRKR